MNFNSIPDRIERESGSSKRKKKRKSKRKFWSE